MKEEYEFIYLKLILLGDTSVGKTNLLLRFTKNKFIKTKKTIMTDFFSEKFEVDYNNTKQLIKIQFWDTAGQELYDSICKTFYKKCNGVMLVFDITNRDSFKNIEKWRREVEANLNIEEVPILLVGNKKDSEYKREVLKEEGEIYAKKFHMIYYETSALNNDDFSVKNAFDIIIQGGVKRNDKDLKKKCSF